MDIRSAIKHNQEGATVVEFSFALAFLFLFLIVFFQIAMIFLAHERVTFAAYIGARVQAVHGNVYRAVSMVKGKHVFQGGDRVTVYESLPLNTAFRVLNPLNSSDFLISQEVSIPVERDGGGDN